MTDLTGVDELTGMIEALDSDLSVRAFTGLGRRVQRELAAHGPVAPERLEQLRREAGVDTAEAEALHALTETDAHGRIRGALGLTVNPTVHEFRVDGQQLYTWCAFDALVFPIAHGWTAEVRSVCPASGQPITFTVTPSDVTNRSPQEAVLGIVTPSEGASADTAEKVKAVYCARNNVYASPRAAHDATAGDPDVAVVSLDDAHRFGQRLVDSLA